MTSDHSGLCDRGTHGEDPSESESELEDMAMTERMKECKKKKKWWKNEVHGKGA